MIYLDLFLGFLRVGCFAFGGAYGAIPLIRDVVLSYGWLTDETLTYMIAVSESTPGPIMVNLATYIGSSQAGFPGAVLATTAVVIPSFVTIYLVTVAMKTLIKSKYTQAVLRGLKPCIIGLILATGIYMTVNNLVSLSGAVVFHPRAAVIAALLAAAMFGVPRLLKKKLSAIQLILLAALLGILVYQL